MAPPTPSSNRKNEMSPIGQSNRFHRPKGSGTRNQQEKICLIVNPRAGAGRAGAHVDTLKRLTDQAFEQWKVVLTEAPVHATHLAAEAAREGFDLVAAVGGDGTCHEVVNGLFENGKPINKKTAFTVIPFGTGSDLVRSLDIPTRTREALWIAATGVTLPTDVGVAEISTEGDPIHELFINVAGFGANGEIVRRSNKSSKKLGGRLTFIGATVATLASYKPSAVRVTMQNGSTTEVWEDELVSAFVANGLYCGGGMWVGPEGSMQDGQFEISLLKTTSALRQAIDFRHLYDGRIGQATGVSAFKCTSLKAEPVDGQRVSAELDGETKGFLPATYEVKKKGLNVRGGWLHTNDK